MLMSSTAVPDLTNVVSVTCQIISQLVSLNNFLLGFELRSLALVHWSVALSWYPFCELSEHLPTSVK